ncbi:uncharacterized protein N7496_005753 [Penicillium cataractarum]|uniref:Uncharacterized protein n=1 Tax=Penicillium cataractarum TaxID=2100454 RepID=A0A9W9SII3_9EURO|nr:uncharacterized protein N7496_005753 [Penicillium cataractarum]KAJ5378344.1 hypothetical protein N7496_005753 [Penicillium cataractarum]
MSDNHSYVTVDDLELLQVVKSNQGPDSKYKRDAVYMPGEWLLEIASAILSLALTIGIACIFWHMDNKPLSDWSAPISLSATISIMTTSYAAAVMHGVSQFMGQLKWLYFKTGPKKLSHFESFDAATRGLWGSLMFITTIKWNLATIGAFITILRLTFAPFAQQVILLEQRDIGYPDSQAAFGYSHQYIRELTQEIANARFAYEYKGASANGSQISFGIIREVNFGTINPWKYTIEDGLSGYLYTNKSESDTISIPAFEISYVNIISLGNFFTSPTIVTEWVDGNFANQNLGLAAALIGDVDISERFEGMAASMTDYLRNGPNVQFAQGERVVIVPFVSIRWAYYIAPVITEVMAMLFAVLTILSNRRSHNVPMWKSSALAVLSCQYNKQLRKLQTTGHDLQEMRESAENTAAWLE